MQGCLQELLTEGESRAAVEEELREAEALESERLARRIGLPKLRISQAIGVLRLAQPPDKFVGPDIEILIHTYIYTRM